uniref:ShKT domain-containing protein n=1 Tax=Elaeophora elaphi TaxID=1147741 RepID=A0A0R3RYQ9_9BILA
MEEDDEDIDSVEYSESETTTDQAEEETEVEEEEVAEEPMTTTLSTIIPYFVTKSLKQTVCTDSSSDCEGKRYLCSERRYADLMKRECPKTCNVCQPDYQTTSHPVTSICHDTAPDCLQSLCNHRSYQQLMQTVCKKTCLLC